MNDGIIKKHKKLIISAASSAIIIALIGGIGLWKLSGMVKSTIVLFDKDTEGVYVLNKDGEKEKLAENIYNIKYDSNLGDYIAVDNDSEMYMISKKGTSNKVASNVVFDTMTMYDQQRVFFIGSDDTLCYKKTDGGKQEVKTDILDYYVLNDNDNIYIDTEDNLIYAKYGAKTCTLASNVSKFKISPDKKYAAYVSENKLFLVELLSHESSEIAENINSGDFQFVDNDVIVYFDNYSTENENGELYYKKANEDRVEIKGDVDSIITPEKNSREGFYYISGDRTLYYYSLKEKSESQVLSNTEKVVFSSNGTAFASDKSNDIYKLKNNVKAEKIFEDAVDFKGTRNSVAIMDKNKCLYIGKNKIADGVQLFDANKNEIMYIDNSNDMYLYKGKHGAKKIGNINDYNRVVFNDDVLYQGNIKDDDLAGCWRYYDYKTKYEAYYKFTDDFNLSEMNFNKPENTYKYRVVSNEDGKMVIRFNEQELELTMNKDKNLLVKYPDGKTLEFKKSSESDYESAHDIIKHVYTGAEKLYGQGNVEFKYLRKVKGYDYYLYSEKHPDNRYKTEVYTDQYGKPYVYEDDSMNPKLDSVNNK